MTARLPRPRAPARGWALLLFAGSLWAAAPAMAADLFHPSGFWVQAGSADQAQALTLGVVWDWDWHQSLGDGLLTGYWETSIGRWHGNGNGSDSSGAAWVTQVGLTPVLRWHPGSWGDGWLLEGGVGVNSLVPIYRSGDKRFSTTLNFSEHIALVRQFGAAHRHEAALRFQHYSNGGLRQPNPGENFVQLRYTWRF